MDLMSSGTSSLVVWLIESTIYVSILICVLLTAKKIAWGKLPAWWCYGMWLVLVVRMLMPWGIESQLSVFNYVPILPQEDLYMPFLMTHDLYTPVVTDPELIREFAAAAADNATWSKPWWNLSLDKALLAVWILGVLISIMAIFSRNLGFWMIVRRKHPISDGSTIGLLEECKALLAVHQEIAVIVTDRIKSPALFGYLRPKLLLPPGILEALDRNELRYVFLHELGHLKRHDIGVSWLISLLQSIHWFNPLVWYAFYHLRVDQEAACDAHVLSRIPHDQTNDYAQTIIGLLERFCQNRQLPALAGILENRSQIKRRIAMIVRFRKNSPRVASVSVLLFLMVGMVLLTGAQELPDEKLYTLSEVDQPPRIIRKVDPLYPPAAAEGNLQGTVTLRFVVNSDGQVRDPEIEKSNPVGVFDDAALKAIVQWIFKPAVKGGKPVQVVVVTPLHFTIPDQSGADEAHYEIGELTKEEQRVLYAAQEAMKRNAHTAGRRTLLDYLATKPASVPRVLYYMLGYSYTVEGRMAEAMDVYREGHEAYPRDTDVLQNYAIASWQSEHFPEAAFLFEKLYGAAAAKESEWLQQAAAAWHRAGNHLQAKRVLKEMLGLPEVPQPEWYRMIIDVCTELGQPEEAEGYGRRLERLQNG